MTTLSTFLRAGLLTLLPLAAAAQLNPAPAMVEVKTQGATPLIRLRLQTGGGFYLGGAYDLSTDGTNIPAAGSGTRLMWYPERAAFRVGYVDGTQWDDANIGSYSIAGGYNTRAFGDYGTAFGYNSVAAQVGSTAIGQYCTASGAASVALGYYAHTNARQGSFVFSDRSVRDDGNPVTDESFRALVNHSANWRVTGGFRVVTAVNTTDGSYNATRGVSILPGNTATTTDWGQSSALIATSSGAYLSAAGVWTNTSDVHKKHLFEAVSGEDVLARLRYVPIQRWSYKAENARVRHLGPMAQDFRRAFGLGPDSVSIGTVDADGVALAGVQALEVRTRHQATQLAALQSENNALRARLDALERPARPAGMPLVASLLALGLVGGGLAMRKRR
jgi:hypothetical protein